MTELTSIGHDLGPETAAAEEIVRALTQASGPIMSRDDALKFVAIALREVRLKEQDRCCRLIYGHCNSDNVAARTVRAIRSEAQP